MSISHETGRDTFTPGDRYYDMSVKAAQAEATYHGPRPSPALPDVTRDGGDFLPGHPWPTEQTPEPPGTFTPNMHTADPVKRPTHYARWAIEPITFIMANNLPFCVGNVIKYVMRYDAKNGREDLDKARRYIDMLLEDMDRKEKGTVADCVGRPL